MENFDFESEITKRYGQIRRARGNFLYTQKNVRLLDMYLDNGASILGWSKGQSRLFLKNTLDRGFSAAFTNGTPANLNRALKQLFAGFNVFKIYSCREDLQNAFEVYKDFCAKTGTQNAQAENLTVWRPWQNFAASVIAENLNCFAFVLPFSWNGAQVFACKTDNPEELYALLPEDEPVNKPLEAAYCRSIYDLIAELSVRSAEQYAQYDEILKKYWNRQGAYLLPKVSADKYKDFFIYCLENRVLISPCYEKPSIVPFGISAGSLTAIKNSSFQL